MADNQAPRPSAISRILHSWQAPALVAALIVLALMVWALPRRVDRVLTVDGTAVWEAGDVPPRREIVWQPARPLPELSPPAGDTQQIAPRLADNGATLYFTQRIGDAHADVFRARLEDGVWQPPEPVEELNTDADEIAPFLSRDGRALFFYSDRPGGEGGYDIYVSERTDDGWSEPRNLGSQINTVAHEYDPAVSADGLTLYFASNRTEEMLRRAASAHDGPAEWTTTLRARMGKTNFDLYQAHREATGEPWKPAVAIAELNRPDSNEGAPHVSPDGAFLYFASDRTARPNELPNLDLYRARRMGDRFAEPQNLGTSVNTAAHETEPALSPEGFTLVFSTNREGRDRLYLSSAQEIFSETAWDTSHLAGLARFWWTALWLTLLAAALLAALLLLRGRLLRRVHVSRFFLGSVLLHLLLLLLLAVWTLPTVVEMIVTRLHKADPATDLFSDNQHQSHQAGQEAYEKVADLQSIDRAVIPEMERLEIVPQSVPQRTDDPRPTIPLEVARQLPPERLLFIPPEPQQPQREPVPPNRAEPSPLVRQPVTQRSTPRELAEAPQDFPLQPEAIAALRQIESQVDLSRQTSEAVDPAAPMQQTPADEPPTPPAASPAAVAAIPSENEPEVNASRTPTLARQSPTATRSAAEIAEDVDSSIAALEQAVPAESELAAADAGVVRRDLLVEPLAKASLQPVETAEPFRPRSATPTRREQAEPQPAQLQPAQSTVSLQRASSLAELSEDLALLETEAAPELAEAAPAPESEVDATEVDLARDAAPTLSASVPTPRELTGPASRFGRRPVIGALADERNDAAPSLSPLASRLDRRRARATRVAIAEDNVGLRSMFTLRQGDTRRQYIELFGGTEASERAVNRGLEWLAAHQHENGSWSLNKFHENCKDHGKCSGAGTEQSDTAATGFSLLPFLAAGHTHNTEGPYQQTVAAGIAWLVGNQKPEGDLLASGDGQHMYSQGIAAIALCEAFGMTQDPELKQPAQKSLDFIAQAQHQGSGGWRYKPNEHGDTSVVGWQMMALKSGQMAGLSVSQQTLDGADRWLKSAEGNQPVGGMFAYQGRGASPAMTAEGLLCVQFLGADRNSPRMRAGADYLLKHLPEKNQQLTSYYWYYATQVMYHMQGNYWEAWNDSFRDLLVETQEGEGPLAGTWQPRDQWEQRGGRLYATAMKLLMLEVYYRHLPLYEQLDE